ncbi:hypothetical protein HDU79_008406 [Rhizoclosmatium sp. JEL0117]|nr:hypothetical protein HDU79_008406 [Rhizoclosmatium sp. JEL0117]
MDNPSEPLISNQITNDSSASRPTSSGQRKSVLKSRPQSAQETKPVKVSASRPASSGIQLIRATTASVVLSSQTSLSKLPPLPASARTSQYAYTRPATRSDPKSASGYPALEDLPPLPPSERPSQYSTRTATQQGYDDLSDYPALEDLPPLPPSNRDSQVLQDGSNDFPSLDKLPPLPESNRPSQVQDIDSETQDSISTTNTRTSRAQTAGIDQLLLFTGKWVGYYATGGPRSKLTDPEACFSYNIQFFCKEDGTVIGRPLTKEKNFEFTGSIKSKTISFEEISVSRFRYPIQATGTLSPAPSNTLALKWTKKGLNSSEPGFSGAMQLTRLAPDTPKQFLSGKYHGSSYDPETNSWKYFSFPWLECAPSGFIYGKPLPSIPDRHTVRGVYSSHRITICITVWDDSQSTLILYKGLLSSSTGSVFGVRLSTDEYGFDEELMDLEDAMASASNLDAETINFRMWRGCEELEADDTFLKAFEVAEGPSRRWSGTWTFGSVEQNDDCKWRMKYITETTMGGEGTSRIDDILERFVFDGKSWIIQCTIMEIKGKKKIQIYQTFLTSLTLYIYHMEWESDSKMVGRGGVSDDPDTHPFALSLLSE